MSAPLASRCPACSTVFRVVPDQLRVSEGWVRCGRCTEVFNATESLVDLETGAPRAAADAWPRAATPPATDARPPIDELQPGAVAAAPTEASSTPGNVAGEAGTDTTALPATDVDLSAVDTGWPPPPAPDASPPPAGLPAPPQAPRAEVSAEEAADPLGAAPAGEALDPHADPLDAPAHRPAFMRRAERAERWRRPRVRAALAAVALLAVLGLAAQIAYAYRDLAAARFPQARPALERACALLGCRIEAARVIDALSVESSGLARVGRSSVYQLSVTLRNRAGIEVALPALDLALTDTQGRLIARKVLLAADLGAASDTLGAGRETALQATLHATRPDTETVAGYTIELFHP